MPRQIDLPRLRQLMDQVGVDLIVCSSPENVYYLTDLPSSPTAANRLLYVIKRSSPCFCLIPKDGEPMLIVTNSALELARRHTWIKDILTYATGVYIVRQGYSHTDYAKAPLEALFACIKGIEGVKSIGVEAYMPHPYYEALKEALPDRHLVGCEDLLYKLRAIKSDEEIRRYAKATEILVKAFNNVRDGMKDAKSEQELMVILKETILKEGAESWQQSCIAAGPDRGPDIYNQPSDRRLSAGDLVRLDVGCVYQGYTADLSRTIAYKEPAASARDLYTVLGKAQVEAIRSVRPGVKASQIHAIAQDYVRKHYDPMYTRYNVGHGVGVDLWEYPSLSADNPMALERGMTLSVEVPYHVYGLGGFNIEDSVLVTRDGYRVISELPMDLQAV